MKSFLQSLNVLRLWLVLLKIYKVLILKMKNGLLILTKNGLLVQLGFLELQYFIHGFDVFKNAFPRVLGFAFSSLYLAFGS